MLEEQNVTSTLFVNIKFFESFLSEPIAVITGFSEYFGKEDMPLLLHYYPEEKDRNLGCDYEILMFSLEKINNIDNQFLSFISLNTNHTPLKIQNSFDFFAPEFLKPKEKDRYTLVLLIDPEVTKDTKTKNVKEATIQFTFFDYKEYKEQKS